MDYVAQMPQLQDINIRNNSMIDRARARQAAMKDLHKLNPDERMAIMRRLHETPVDHNAITDTGFAKLAWYYFVLAFIPKNES